MPADQLISQIQLAVKTGRFARGDALLPSIQSKKACLVVLSEDCGANRAKKIKDKCAFYQVPLVILPALRFNAISSKVVSAAAITDPGFARRIQEAAQREHLPGFAPAASPESGLSHTGSV